MKTLAIIPARGGSKGVPRKNLVPVNGKPLLVWTIEAAIKAWTVNKVAVSTEDKEIAGIAKLYQVEVVKRPDELATDEASAESVLLHTLAHLKSAGYEPDLVVFLQCTSPLTTEDDIDNVVSALLDQRADSALSVVPFHYFLWNESGEGINHKRSCRPRRQDREPQYIETGGIYVMRTKGFLAVKHRFFGKTIVHVCGGPHMEIDDPFDLAMADALLREKENG